jgi:hypothetical protein
VQLTGSQAGAQLPLHPVAFVRQAALKVWVRCSHWSLDAKLADGIDPTGDSALTVRAAQLIAPRNRERLARVLRRLANECDSKPTGFSAAVPVAYDQVAQARETLLFVADVLHFADGVQPRGVAMLTRLLFDGGSVLYMALPNEERQAHGVLQLQLHTILDYLVIQPPRSSDGCRPMAIASAGDSIDRR